MSKGSGKHYDLHAVAILRGGDVVGHVPHTILTPCNVFIRKGGVITCIICHRQYSLDLEQGGLDMPCKLQFQADNQTTIDKLTNINKYSNILIDDDFRNYRN